MAWIVRIRSAATEAELFASKLWDFGPNAVSETTLTSDSGGYRIELTAGYRDEASATAALEGLRAMDHPSGDHAALEIQWQEPAWTGPAPSWLEVGGQRLYIDAGRSFGHGRHPSTALALDLLTRWVDDGRRVLDVGTGSGVLAIAAAMLGGRAVEAIDIDDEALACARANVAANKVEVTVSDRLLDSIDDTFDVVVANMLAAELRPLATRLMGRCAPNGVLVLSGFLVDQQPWVESMFGLASPADRLERDGWAALVLRR